MQDEIFPDKEHFGRQFRNNAVMSSMGIVQVAAIRMIRLLAVNHDWAADLYDMAYLEHEVEERISHQ